MSTSPRSLPELAAAIDRRADWWRFPEEPGVRGFLGDGPVFFVGDQPSTNAWPPTDRGRRVFYDGLKEAGLGDAHLTDLVKRRGQSSALENGLPDDFERHVAFFREELALLLPRRIVAVGRLCERLLREHVPEVRARLGYVHHFAYAARPHVSLDYPRLLAAAADGKPLETAGTERTRPKVSPKSRIVEGGGMVTAVEALPRGIRPLRWTLRRDNHAHHHGVVTWTGGAVYLQLAWRPRKGAPATPVGTFRLDLAALLEAGCVRYEPDGVVGDRVRIRVVMHDDDSFAVQVRSGAPCCLLR